MKRKVKIKRGIYWWKWVQNWQINDDSSHKSPLNDLPFIDPVFTWHWFSMKLCSIVKHRRMFGCLIHCSMWLKGGRVHQGKRAEGVVSCFPCRWLKGGQEGRRWCHLRPLQRGGDRKTLAVHAPRHNSLAHCYIYTPVNRYWGDIVTGRVSTGWVTQISAIDSWFLKKKQFFWSTLIDWVVLSRAKQGQRKWQWPSDSSNASCRHQSYQYKAIMEKERRSRWRAGRHRDSRRAKLIQHFVKFSALWLFRRIARYNQGDI